VWPKLLFCIFELFWLYANSCWSDIKLKPQMLNCICIGSVPLFSICVVIMESCSYFVYLRVFLDDINLPLIG
jgi:hypothetical protein